MYFILKVMEGIQITAHNGHSVHLIHVLINSLVNSRMAQTKTETFKDCWLRIHKCKRKSCTAQETWT